MIEPLLLVLEELNAIELRFLNRVRYYYGGDGT